MFFTIHLFFFSYLVDIVKVIQMILFHCAIIVIVEAGTLLSNFELFFFLLKLYL